jgi:putative FmdB family regulatory protein
VPLYEYQCGKCKRRTEKIERVAGPHLRKCPHCGGKVERLQSAPSIQFKGSGWYVTDYAGKSGGKESPAEKADKAEKTESKEAAKESAAKESKESKESKEKKAEKKKN